MTALPVSAAGNGWGVTLNAGTAFASTVPRNQRQLQAATAFISMAALTFKPRTGTSTVSAINEVQINANVSTAAGDGIRTLDGGSIDVTTEYGDVNTGAQFSRL